MQTVAEMLFKFVPTLTLTTKTKSLKLQEGPGRPMAIRDTFAGIFRALTVAQQTSVLNLFKDDLQTLALLQTGDIQANHDLHKALLLQISSATEDEKTNWRDASSVDWSSIPILKTYTLADVRLVIPPRHRDSFLWHEEEDRIFPYTWDYLKERIMSAVGKKGFDAFITERGLEAKLGYEPFKPRVTEHADDDEQTVFNLWTPAPWAKGWEAPQRNCKTPDAPELFRFLVDNLARDDASKRMIERWLRDAIFSRAEPILILCGSPGTGKNLLVEEMAASLVGKKNFHVGQRGFRRSQFHANVASCRLFYLDEQPLTEAMRETLKSYHNGLAAIERKFVDVIEPERIHASFVLSNNAKSFICLEHNDRKFCVPDLSPESLEQKHGRDATHEFAQDLKDACETDTFLEEVANYLYLTYEEGESATFPKTETFYACCMNSYPAWCKDLKNFHDEHFPLESIALDSKVALKGCQRRPSFTDAKEALDRYWENTRSRFAYPYRRKDGSWYIVMNPTERHDKEAAAALLDDSLTL